MWFALMVIGIWGFGTLGVYILRNFQIYLLTSITTVILGIGYLIYKIVKEG